MLICGLAPALQAGRVDALVVLRASTRGSSRRRGRVLGVAEPLVVAQIALSLVLAIGTALLVRSLLALEHEPLGFEQAHVLAARLDARLAGYAPADVGTLYRRLYDRVAALPGVESATLARYSPFSGSSSVSTAEVEGYEPRPGERMGIEMIHVGPRYPQTLGMPLRSGRALGVDDRAGGPLTGLYGVVASGVTSRTKEIGVRVALGAARADVLWLIVRETLVRLAIGLVIGIALAAAASRALTSQLFGVTRADPRSYAIAALVLGSVAMLTSAIPALRAARIDPAKTLRAD
jgi:hypothetical protein